MRWLACLCVLAAAVRADAADFRGVVTADTYPLPGATVEMRCNDVRKQYVANDQGQFAFDVEPGNWELSVMLPGFVTPHRTICILDGENTYDVRMPSETSTRLRMMNLRIDRFSLGLSSV